MTAADPTPEAVLAAIDPSLAALPLSRLGEGWDNVVHAVGDELVLRIVKDPHPLDVATHVARDVALLELAARVCPVAVGEVVATHEAHGALLCRRVPGVAFDDLPEADQARWAVDLARQVAEAIAPVHAVARAEVPPSVEEPEPLAVRLAEEADEVAEVRSRIAPDVLVVVDAHLASPVPEDPAPRALCHNDLGGEHVMVDPADGRLTGIIDWTDALWADPVRDLCLLLADLGETAFAAAVAAHPGPFDGSDLARARWYATGALAGTLAYHLRLDDDAGVRRTEARLRRLRDVATG